MTHCCGSKSSFREGSGLPPSRNGAYPFLLPGTLAICDSVRFALVPMRVDLLASVVLSIQSATVPVQSGCVSFAALYVRREMIFPEVEIMYISELPSRSETSAI